MDSTRWQRVQSLFHEAVDLPEDERRGFLETQCRGDGTLVSEVLNLLQEDARGGSLLDGNVAQVAHQVLSDPSSAAPPFKEFGPYRIKKALGEGGMGVVYLADREDLGSQVAIKVLRDAWLSPARRERFASEQKTLAALNHPSIARLYDADTSADGTPWFVMEYVDGLPLNEYCEKNNCSIETRLKLFRAVCDAVEYAHERGVIHRDLKPSNILVKRDGAVRLLDFGIAKQTEPASTLDQTRTGMQMLTPAYASPEQIRGQPSTPQSDVYSLGVVLYELLTKHLPVDLSQSTPLEAAERVTTNDPEKPSTAARGVHTASWNDLDIICLTAMHKDAERRYGSVEALIRDLDHYLKQEPIEARPDSFVYVAGKFAQRNRSALSALAVFLIFLMGAAAVAFKYSNRTPGPRGKSVAVIPFRNATGDPSLDYLGIALGNQISGTLEYVRDLSVRPFETARRYAGADVDAQEAGRELHASYVISGGFLKQGNQLQLTMEMIDVESSRLVLRQTFNIPAGNMLAMQAQIAAKTLRGVVPLLRGLGDYAALAQQMTDSATQPRNEEAYELFLRAVAMGREPGVTKRARAMLERSVALDEGYAPAWAALSAMCEVQNWYSDGGSEAARCARETMDRAAALDPNNPNIVGAHAANHMIPGENHRSYLEFLDLVRRHSDSARAHFWLSYALRYAGLLEQSESQCESALLLDPQDAGVRSCAVAFILHGDYGRALDYLRLDLGSEWGKALTLDVLLREGKLKEAWDARPAKVPQWGAYGVLLAYLEHRPASEVAALGSKVMPNEDAEVNYFSAAHLAYAGQTDAAFNMLKTAIDGGYCSYPAIDSDPLLAGVRTVSRLGELRKAAIACQENFTAGRP
jgi:serine/threonine protein kinase